jgi:hypothetical protein
MRIPTLFRSRLFLLMLMAGIAVASVAYNFHLRQRVDASESENAKLKKEKQMLEKFSLIKFVESQTNDRPAEDFPFTPAMSVTWPDQPVPPKNN